MKEAGPLTWYSSVFIRPDCGSLVVTATESDLADCNARIE
jgi:hypothetical protein